MPKANVQSNSSRGLHDGVLQAEAVGSSHCFHHTRALTGICHHARALTGVCHHARALKGVCHHARALKGVCHHARALTGVCLGDSAA
jgi:hypothetical protein